MRPDRNRDREDRRPREPSEKHGPAQRCPQNDLALSGFLGRNGSFSGRTRVTVISSLRLRRPELSLEREPMQPGPVPRRVDRNEPGKWKLAESPVWAFC